MIQPALEIASRQISLELSEIKNRTSDGTDEIFERQAAKGMLASSATLQLVANLYKKEINDYASAVGDAVMRLIDAQGTEYLTKREGAFIGKYGC